MIRERLAVGSTSIPIDQHSAHTQQHTPPTDIIIHMSLLRALADNHVALSHDSPSVTTHNTAFPHPNKCGRAGTCTAASWQLRVGLFWEQRGPAAASDEGGLELGPANGRVAGPCYSLARCTRHRPVTFAGPGVSVGCLWAVCCG